MKEGGILRIGDNMDIYVQHIGGGQVRLCLSVPREIPIKHLPPEQPQEGRQPEVVTRAQRRR